MVQLFLQEERQPSLLGPKVFSLLINCSKSHTWRLGNIYAGTSSTGRFIQGGISAPSKPSALLDSQGRIFGRGRPQYEDYAVSQFISVKDYGAKGDGRTDDTTAIKDIFAKVASVPPSIGCERSFTNSMLVAKSSFSTPVPTSYLRQSRSQQVFKSSVKRGLSSLALEMRLRITTILKWFSKSVKPVLRAWLKSRT